MQIERTCPVCGKTYQADTTRLKWGRQTTCSRACSYQLRATNLETGHVMTCSVCGRQFYRSPAQVKAKHEGVYCSIPCHYAGRSTGLTKRIVSKPYTLVSQYDRSEAGQRAWRTRHIKGNDRHSEATRQHLREKTAAAIASGKFARVSQIEYVVAKKLAALGVNAIHQFGIRDPASGRYVAAADFFLPEHNTVIEVNGTFWHADPRFYDPGKLTPAQRRTADRYATKLDILRQRGINLIEIWEHDIRQDADNAVVNAMRPIL